MKPLRNLVLLRPDTKKETKSGIILSKEEAPEYGIVAYIGSGAEEVKVGDKVLFYKEAPRKVEIDDCEYLVCDEDDIIAICE